jgi:asparagine synthase (glutamine-hydrolysing)
MCRWGVALRRHSTFIYSGCADAGANSIPVKTYTIGFHVAEYNEAEAAKAVARHLGTDHTELYVTPQETQDVIPRLPQLYDEPFADSSQIPTFLVCELARRHVTVSLSGDGGDELFGGYTRYLWAEGIWKRLRYLPQPARQLAAGAIRQTSPARWDAVYAGIEPLLPPRLRQSLPGDKLYKLAGVLPPQIKMGSITVWSRCGRRLTSW